MEKEHYETLTLQLPTGQFLNFTLGQRRERIGGSGQSEWFLALVIS